MTTQEIDRLEEKAKNGVLSLDDKVELTGHLAVQLSDHVLKIESALAAMVGALEEVTKLVLALSDTQRAGQMAAINAAAKTVS